MLARAHRMTRGLDFSRTMRSGRKCARRAVVVHLWIPSRDAEQPGEPPMVGFAVSKSVGNAVVRNRVRRRLQHAVLSQLALLPESSTLVIRALPRSADAGFEQLEDELALAVQQLLKVAKGAEVVA